MLKLNDAVKYALVCLSMLHFLTSKWQNHAVQKQSTKPPLPKEHNLLKMGVNLIKEVCHSEQKTDKELSTS